ncbi:ABC transporter ATP-binding protein [Mobiluncus mulieris]|uniref:ABC transporter ATP-binding protein n=1 Tax=Mobiluncus mulieris TaxID=2052 RepID=A0ABD4U0U2_9ACTO|nr:ABC transporter ATP-binding protein [Mobiluncus mulieris]MCU9969158.1 ABC transporter ATP-binding protein [Mobiluncus mulieris]MCU9973495.1 ABC transporter ATP-binding protein [Mobiluncus mulieris]MCV0009583.1 ABC transporter ATP-binding protein [Mobiluncus mulieris]NMW75419.1 ABC transporter ATP-binding protein [Mobiluncus mulieris]NMX19699.1 ABC transporter ATP-binding protein [Mobiluncus mulieris]
MNASTPQAPHENGFAPLNATAPVSSVANPAGNSIGDSAGLGASNASPAGFAAPVPTPGVTETPRPAIATLADVTKVYGKGQNAVTALNHVNLGIRAQECTVIMGPSGSGKSTLLHVLAGLDAVTSGTITVGGTEITRLTDKPLTKWRREQIGFVFQSFNLVPTLDARANIELPLRLAGKTVDPDWFQAIVESLNLGQRLRHKPWELSGGQVQRVAVARALLSRPAILVADEPTGNLDSVSSAEVLGLLGKAVKDFGQTVVMVTHDRRAAAIGDRVLVVKDGQIVHDLAHPSADQIAQVA